MNYQKCPVCNGSGMLPTEYFNQNKTCPTCNGFRIISSLTGKPISEIEINENLNQKYRNGWIKAVGTTL